MGTVPVPYVPVAGDDATQARVLTWADAANYLLGNTTSGGSRRPFAVLRQTVAQSLANATAGALNMDVEDIDYDNSHSTVTNISRFTAATAGLYHIDFGVAFAANAAGRRQAWLKVNGATDLAASAALIQAVTVAGVPTVATGSRKFSLNAGDYIELIGFQDSGGALLTSVGGTTQSWMTIEWRSN